MDTDNIKLIFAGYARKSSEDNKERQAASLPDQIFIIEGIKSKYNLKLTSIFQESRSAYEKGREEFEHMLNLIEKREINAILTWHPNRLARNMTDGGRVIDLFDTGRLLEVRTPSRTYHNTPEDKFMLNLEFSLSKKDSDDKSIVVSRGLEKKCRDGYRPGVAPQGYLNDKATESGLRKIFTDAERFPFIKKIFELFHGGTAVTEIQRIAREEWGFRTAQKKRMGGKPLALSTIYSILANPFYCGKFEYPVGSGKWYEGKHERAVSEEMFNEIQIKLGHRSQYKLKHHEYAYSSLIRCGTCDGGIVPEQKWQCICRVCKFKFSLTKNNNDKCPKCLTLISEMVNPKVLHYVHYRCKHRKGKPCKELGIRIEDLEKQVDEKLSQVEISPLFLDWAIMQIQKMSESEKSFREDAVEAIKRSHDACRAKLDNLLRLKISPENSDGSLLSDEKYKLEKNSLEVELESLEKQLENVDGRMLQAHEDTVKAFNFATKARDRFANGDLKTKRDIFMGLGSHLMLKDRKVQFDAPKYLFKLKEMKEDAPIIAKTVAPIKDAEIEAKSGDIFASIPTLLRGWESHPAWKIMSLPCNCTLPRVSNSKQIELYIKLYK